MRFASILSLMLFLTFAAIGDCQFGLQKSPFTGITKPHSRGSAKGRRSTAFTFKDMLLGDIYTHSFLDNSGALNRAATCKSCSSRMAERKIAAISPSANCDFHISQLERPKFQY
jgi:hypothetical protein